jgi:predicted esterase YcpF (UPF0227 family)
LEKFKMKILNIHGYNGNPLNSAYEAIKSFDIPCVSIPIDYDNLGPNNILEMLKNVLAEEEITHIVGTSLGGFFGLCLSAKLDYPIITINPCLLPMVYLPRLGYLNKNNPKTIDKNPQVWYNKKEELCDYAKLCHLPFEVDKRLLSTIVGLSDEIIDTLDYTKGVIESSRYYEIEGAGHRISPEKLIPIFEKVLFHKYVCGDFLTFDTTFFDE